MSALSLSSIPIELFEEIIFYLQYEDILNLFHSKCFSLNDIIEGISYKYLYGCASYILNGISPKEVDRASAVRILYEHLNHNFSENIQSPGCEQYKNRLLLILNNSYIYIGKSEYEDNKHLYCKNNDDLYVCPEICSSTHYACTRNTDFYCTSINGTGDLFLKSDKIKVVYPSNLTDDLDVIYQLVPILNHTYLCMTTNRHTVILKPTIVSNDTMDGYSKKIIFSNAKEYDELTMNPKRMKYNAYAYNEDKGVTTLIMDPFEYNGFSFFKIIEPRPSDNSTLEIKVTVVSVSSEKYWYISEDYDLFLSFTSDYIRVSDMDSEPKLEWLPNLDYIQFVDEIIAVVPLSRNALLVHSTNEYNRFSVILLSKRIPIEENSYPKPNYIIKLDLYKKRTNQPQQHYNRYEEDAVNNDDDDDEIDPYEPLPDHYFENLMKPCKYLNVRKLYDKLNIVSFNNTNSKYSYKFLTDHSDRIISYALREVNFRPASITGYRISLVLDVN